MNSIVPKLSVCTLQTIILLCLPISGVHLMKITPHRLFSPISGPATCDGRHTFLAPCGSTKISPPHTPHPPPSRVGMSARLACMFPHTLSIVLCSSAPRYRTLGSDQKLPDQSHTCLWRPGPRAAHGCIFQPLVLACRGRYLKRHLEAELG